VGVKSLKEWLAEGEQLYGQAMSEYKHIESQLEQLEHLLASKRTEVNQIAHVIGRPPVEPSRRVAAQIVEAEAVPPVVGSVTRALTGRGLGRA
jgi:hypothetical protein